jgi:hypothetical protein
MKILNYNTNYTTTSILLLLLAVVYSTTQHNNITEHFENTSCQKDCKCVNYDATDESLAFCGYNDKVLGLVACTDCDDNVYQTKCKKCIPHKIPDINKNNKQILKYDDKHIESQYSTNTLNNEEIIKLNKKQIAQKEMHNSNYNNRLYNLSISTIFTNLSNTTIDIINELFNYTNNNTKYEINKIMYIFTKDDRSIYIGVIFIILSLTLYFIDITN